MNNTLNIFLFVYVSITAFWSCNVQLKSFNFSFGPLLIRPYFSYYSYNVQNKKLIPSVYDASVVYLNYMVTKEKQWVFFVFGAERNLKSNLYSYFVISKRNCGCLTLRFEDVCKRNINNFNISTDERGELANDCVKCRSYYIKKT